MTIEEIKLNLCYNDERNPDYNDLHSDDCEEEEHVRQDNCFCDNCFYGRTKLANELLLILQP